MSSFEAKDGPLVLRARLKGFAPSFLVVLATRPIRTPNSGAVFSPLFTLFSHQVGVPIATDASMLRNELFYTPGQYSLT